MDWILVLTIATIGTALITRGHSAASSESDSVSRRTGRFDSMLGARRHPYQTDSVLQAGPPPYQTDSTLRAGPLPYQTDSMLRAGPPPYQTDCVRGQELCMADTVCSSSLRTLRQCVAGSGDLLELKECVAAVEALQSSALYYCRCRRGMRREKSCLRIYWVMNEGLARGDDLFESSPYEPTSYLLQALATGKTSPSLTS
uniref:GDNF/GAS1 domain-containing protein n=1 Tax=Eptatretus burgeri TaxID=7764 RepID=A0A8C4QCJ6_EPTBU